MGKQHLKRLAAPKAWRIDRKTSKFITKPLPGSHKLTEGLPLGVLLKEILKYARTNREAKKLLNMNEVKIDGIARKEFRLLVGIFDTIEFSSLNQYFRLILNKKGQIDLIKIDREESLTKPCKIIGKTMLKGKLQLNFYDGKNIIVNKNSYKVGDSVLLLLPEQKIAKDLPLAKNSTIFLIGGKHMGEIGIVEEVREDKIIYRSDKTLVETLKKYAFVIGDEKPLIKLI